MTDGIIQKVYMEILLDCGGHTDTIVSLDRFEHRLIEEIKKCIEQKINCHAGFSSCCISDSLLKEELIGDS